MRMIPNQEKYKKLLEDEKTRLEGELSGISKRNPHNPAEWDAVPENQTEEADLNVAADIHEDIEERHAVSDELEKRLEDVSGALLAMDEETYGACEVCGGAIEGARLNADPAAPTCTAHMN